jgi:AAA15 family ATPase/GTPase
MSKLTGVYLNNFQSIKGPIFLALDKLCFFYGPNSAGKSSILDALDLVRKTIRPETTMYRTDYLYRKNEGNSNGFCEVGIELIAQKFDSDNEEVKAWWESLDQRGDNFHQDFFKKIFGKKIQIEFGARGHALKVAINGEPLLEILSDCTDYDDFYRRDPLCENGTFIIGKLVLHKKNQLNFLYDFDIKEFASNWPGAGMYRYEKFLESHFYDLFVQENDDTLSLNGIVFSDDRSLKAGFIGVDHNLDEVIFPAYKSKEYRSEDEDYQKFISFHFDEIKNKGAKHISTRKNFYWSFCNIARDIDKLVKGIFYQIESALEYSHVRGDRQIINSKDCLSYPRYFEDLVLSNCKTEESDPSSLYAQFLHEPTGSIYPRANMKGDFPNKALCDYLLSLRGYEVYPIAYEMKLSDIPIDQYSPTRTFIYLKLKNKAKKELGFEDVGSGISYVFPILTSLWASKFSFIEQPELHLHPSAQCELGDVFIAACNQGSSAVVESHSEHLLLRVLRRIRETSNDYLLPKELKFSSESFRIYYFKPEPEGYTSVKEIKVDKHGEFLNSWPDGFFSERDRELFDE